MNHDTMQATSPAARGWRRAAVAILIVGAIAAAAAYVHASASDAGADADADTAVGAGSIAERRELQQLERLGGKAAVMTLRFQQAFESLFHGQRLVITVVVIAVLAAALCLHLAALAAEDAPDRQ